MRSSIQEYMTPIPQSPTRMSIRSRNTGFPEPFCGSKYKATVYGSTRPLTHAHQAGTHHSHTPKRILAPMPASPRTMSARRGPW